MMPDGLRQQVQAMRAIFARTDAATRDYAQRSGLICPPGCGACCNNPRVEATVTELLPLAVEIVTLGQDEGIYTQAAAGAGARCVLFRQVGMDAGRGYCSQYAHRPLVCRLFGFAGVKAQDGRVALAACRVHKNTQPDVVKSAPQAPLMSDFAMEAIAAAGGGGPNTERLPINEALLRAIEFVALRAHLLGKQLADPK